MVSVVAQLLELVLQETRSSEKVVTRVSGHSVPGAEYAPQIRCNLMVSVVAQLLELVLQETRSSEKVVTRVSGHSVPGAEYAPQIRCNLMVSVVAQLLELVLQETRSPEKVVTRVSGHSVPGAEYAPQIRCNLTAESLYFKKQDRQRRLSLVFRDILFRVRNMLLKYAVIGPPRACTSRNKIVREGCHSCFGTFCSGCGICSSKYAVIGPPRACTSTAVQLQRI